MTDRMTFTNAKWFEYNHDRPNKVEFLSADAIVFGLPFEAIVEGFECSRHEYGWYEVSFAETIVISTVNLEWVEFTSPKGVRCIEFRRSMAVDDRLRLI